MNIEELKKQAETEIADFIAQKIAELNKNTGKESLKFASPHEKK